MEKIKVSMVVEILGKPKEHVTESLEKLIDKLKEEKEIKLLDKKLHEPVPIENSDLFTTFAELDLELENISNYFALIFVYLPSHIEITNPEKLNIGNAELNEFGNALTQRLHNYETVVKKVWADRDAALRKLQEVAPHLFKQTSTPETKQIKKKTPKKTKKKSKKKSR